MLIFRRRDTRTMALVAGILGAAPVLAWRGTWPGKASLAAAAVVLAAMAAASVCVMRRRLPTDIVLTTIPAAEAARIVARPDITSPASGPATALVKFEPDWLRRHRLDVMLDSVLAAQLMPGQAVLVPLPERSCKLSFNLGMRRVTHEQLNGIPGTTSGFAIRIRQSSRPLVMEVSRFAPSPDPFTVGAIRLVHPAPWLIVEVPADRDGDKP